MPRSSAIYPAAIAVAIICALVLTACGGGDSAPAISKAELIRRADKICEQADNTEFDESVEYEQKHRQEFADLSPQKRVKELLVIVGLPSILAEVDEIEALGMPASDTDKLTDFYRAARTAVARARENPETIEQPNGPFAKPNGIAKAYGFKACSEIA